MILLFSALIPFVLALVIMLFVGSPLIRWLKFRPGMKWTPREDTPETHNLKAGVPSMGGIGIIAAAFLGWLLVAGLVVGGGLLLVTRSLGPGMGGPSSNEFAFILGFLFLVPVVTVGHAVLGYIDDLSKAQKRGGITSKQKLAGQLILGTLFLVGFAVFGNAIARFGFGTPHVGTLISPFWWPVLLLVLVGTSNAVNLTDGIDGLAASLCFQVSLVLATVSILSGVGEEFLATIPFWLALGGACLGFFWFNKFPAKVFMGDTGSLALGAALGAAAIASGTMLLLPFIGFIFFVEMFSVIFQVVYFKLTKKKFGEGKRLFRRAPIHHHFELGGWSERKVVTVFWFVNLATSALGLWLWDAGVLPRFPM